MLPLTALGLLVGFPIAGVVSSYEVHGVFRAWPPGDLRRAGTTAIPIATAVAFAMVGVRPAGQAGHAAHVVAAACEAGLLVAVAFIDLRVRLVPTALVASLVALALADAALWSGLGAGPALLGGGVGFAVFAALAALARLAFGSGALGWGDATIALAIGCIAGYPLVVVALSMGTLFGALAAAGILLAARAARRADVGLRTTIPYAPFLILGLFYALAGGGLPF